MDWKSISIAFGGVLGFFGFVIGIIALIVYRLQKARIKNDIGNEGSPKNVKPFSKYKGKINKKEGEIN